MKCMLLVPEQELLMTKNSIPANRDRQPEPNDLERAVPLASHDQADLSELQVQLNQVPSSTTCIVTGRKPLFGR